MIVAAIIALKNLNGLVEAVNLLTNEEKEILRIDWYGSDGNDKSRNKRNKIRDITLIMYLVFEPTLLYMKSSNGNAVGLFSHLEELPNAVCEGMSAGKPVIASNVSISITN